MHGKIVFAKPQSALRQMKTDFAEGIRFIQKKEDLADLTHKNYETYMTYGWQISDGTVSEKHSAQTLADYLDIYENSFKR